MHGVTLPWVLQFIVEAYQLFKARACGADAVLLIAAVLPNNDLAYLIKSVKKLGMQTLIEASCHPVYVLQAITLCIINIRCRLHVMLHVGAMADTFKPCFMGS